MLINKKINKSVAAFLVVIGLVVCSFASENGIIKPAFAQSSITINYTPIPLATGPVDCAWPCSIAGSPAAIAGELKTATNAALRAAAQSFETALITAHKKLVFQFKADIDGIEKALAIRWREDWFKAVLPALKNMTDQINVAMVEEVRQIQSFSDSNANTKVLRKLDLLEAESERENRPSIHANVAATAAGGYGRAVGFSRAMRLAISKEMIDAGINKKGDDKNLSSLNYNKYRAETYNQVFCDPKSEGGSLEGVCQASDEKIYNADVEPNKFIYSRLTIPMDPDVDPEGKMFKALMAIRVNLFGSSVGDTMPASALQSNAGREVFLQKRSYLARYGAIMSVHNLIESWRMPGSDMGDWMKSILEKDEEADPKGDWYSHIENPSYKELIHGMTIDRFNSGHYAQDLITTSSDIKMEKLSLTALQLMQLRDYYELLERTALVLAVQVSLMTDNYEISSGVNEVSTGTSN